jgi:hypothetical protein
VASKAWTPFPVTPMYQGIGHVSRPIGYEDTFPLIAETV